jgi:hypothetical protein
MPTVTIELFDETVQNVDDPEAVKLRAALKDIAEHHGSRLDRFEVQSGVVTFHIANKEACAAVLTALVSVTQSVPEYLLDEDEFEERTARMRTKRRRI